MTHFLTDAIPNHCCVQDTNVGCTLGTMLSTLICKSEYFFLKVKSVKPGLSFSEVQTTVECRTLMGVALQENSVKPYLQV